MNNNKLSKLSIILLLFFLTNSHATPNLNSVTMPFLKNIGQVDKQVDYYTKTPNASVYIDKQANINYHIIQPNKVKSVLIKEHFIKGQAVAKSVNGQFAKINILKGKGATQWHKNIPNASEIDFGEVWEGIEVKLASRPGNVEKIFTLKPHASVKKIHISLQGTSNVTIKDNGELSLQTEMGSVTFTKPIAWQNIAGESVSVDVSYVIDDNNYGFKLGQYDHSKEVIIDPLLASTYVGGGFDEAIAGIRVNNNNEIIVVGSTSSTDFPTTAGVFSSTTAGSYDFFAMRFNPDMSQLLAATYFGGSSSDFALVAAFALNGDIYFAGQSQSTDFPIPPMPYVPFQQLQDANGSIFIAGLSADLTRSLGATYIGGGIVDLVRAIAVAPNGNVYVTGFTNSTDYPYKMGAFESTGKGIIISAFNSDLSDLLYSTRVGEGDGSSISIDVDGSVFLGAVKNGSQVYTTTAGVYGGMPINSLGFQIYLAHLNADLSTLITATFITFGDVRKIIITPQNDLLINAKTSGFPISSNAFDTSPATTNNATIFKMDKAMTTLGASTYIDLDNDALMLESDGNILVFGATATLDFPGGNSPSDPINTGFHGGQSDFAIARLNANMTQVTHSSYIGGSNREFHGFGLAEDSQGNVIVAGRTDSNDVMTTPNAFDSTYAGQNDVIVLKATHDLNFGPLIDGIFCDSFESPSGNGACL